MPLRALSLPWPRQLDVSPLDKVKRHNHDFPILTLDNPKGQVLAKSKATLKVRIATPCLLHSHSFSPQQDPVSLIAKQRASAADARLVLTSSLDMTVLFILLAVRVLRVCAVAVLSAGVPPVPGPNALDLHVSTSTVQGLYSLSTYIRSTS